MFFSTLSSDNIQKFAVFIKFSLFSNHFLTPWRSMELIFSEFLETHLRKFFGCLRDSASFRTAFLKKNVCEKSLKSVFRIDCLRNRTPKRIFHRFISEQDNCFLHFPPICNREGKSFTQRERVLRLLAN